MEFFRRHFSNIVCFPGANNMKEIGALPRHANLFLTIICQYAHPPAVYKYKFAPFRGIFQRQ
jgi:hypothetical protein